MNQIVNGQVTDNNGNAIAYIDRVNRNYTKVVLLDKGTPYISLIFQNLTEKEYIERAKLERKIGVPSYESEYKTILK